MSDTLSIILPICNAESRLVDHVERLLEVASELTNQFELAIVDDASTDSTAELARELCRTYPQILLIRRSETLGVIGAARLGISETQGEIVLIHDLESPLSCEAIRKLWAMRLDRELVFARSAWSRDRLAMDPAEFGSSVTAWSGTQLLRRQALHELQLSANRPDQPSRLRIDRVTRTDMASSVVSIPVLQQLTAERKPMQEVRVTRQGSP